MRALLGMWRTLWEVVAAATAAAKSLQSCPTLCDPIDTSPPSLGFSRQEHWSGLPFPSPMHESEKWKWSRSVVSDPQLPHGLQPSRLLHPYYPLIQALIFALRRTGQMGLLFCECTGSKEGKSVSRVSIYSSKNRMLLPPQWKWPKVITLPPGSWLITWGIIPRVSGTHC